MTCIYIIYRVSFRDIPVQYNDNLTGRNGNVDFFYILLCRSIWSVLLLSCLYSFKQIKLNYLCIIIPARNNLQVCYLTHQ